MVIKRFWKLITLSIIIIAIMVTYFIQTSIVIANQFPVVEIKTIGGDEREIEDVYVIGQYYQGEEYGNSLTVSQKGSTYLAELSYFEQLDPDFPPNEVTSIKEKNRNFMRGIKGYSPSSYFESERYLAYVGAHIANWEINSSPEYYFSIDVLDKQTMDRATFNLDLLGEGNLSDLQVLDVQVINGELKVITKISKYVEAHHQYLNEIKIYTIDFENEQFKGDNTILMEDLMKDSWSDFELLNDRNDITESANLLLVKNDFQKTVLVENEETDYQETEFEITGRTIFIYNLVTQDLTKIQLTEEQQLAIDSNNIWGFTGFISDSNFTITYSLEDQLMVTNFNIESLKEESSYYFDLKELGIEEYMVTMKDRKLYVSETIKNHQNPAKLFIGDVSNGEVLYEGEIVLKNDRKDDYSLYFYRILIN